jgi:hypothetical protein
LRSKWSKYQSGQNIEVVKISKWSKYQSCQNIKVVKISKLSKYQSCQNIKVVKISKLSKYWLFLRNNVVCSASIDVHILSRKSPVLLSWRKYFQNYNTDPHPPAPNWLTYLNDWEHVWSQEWTIPLIVGLRPENDFIPNILDKYFSCLKMMSNQIFRQLF